MQLLQLSVMTPNNVCVCVCVRVAACIVIMACSKSIWQAENVPKPQNKNEKFIFQKVVL